MTSQKSATASTLPLVANVSEAEELVGHFDQIMDALVEAIEQETDLVRRGRLREAATVGTSKMELARIYIADSLRLKASHGYLSKAIPEALRRLGQRHDSFRAVLQMNLTVLATAHAVSEGIVRGVSNELGRKAAPTTYGARAQTSVARPAVQPLALSRVL
jgi:hypothetical protein